VPPLNAVKAGREFRPYDCADTCDDKIPKIAKAINNEESSLNLMLGVEAENEQ
jgi:hypothetical protein